MKKRLLAALLSATMLLTFLPMTALNVTAAGSPVVDIPDTTGTGLSAADPIICDKFVELKAALEYDGEAYVRISSSLSEQLPETSNAWEPAITMVGTKYLDLRGAGIYESSSTKDYDCLIKVEGDLTVDGSGSLRYGHSNNFGNGSVFLMENSTASLTINDGIFSGDFTMSRSPDDSWAFGRAIVATGGTLTIHDGSFSASVYDGPGAQSYMHRSAVYMGRGVKATINGGSYVASRTYSSASPVDTRSCGMTFAPNDPENITLNGGEINGMYITGAEKALSAYLGDNCFFYDKSASTRFKGDVKESPYDDVGSVRFHTIEVRNTDGALQFGVQNPSVSASEATAGVTDLGTYYTDNTAVLNKTFSFTAARLPDDVLYSAFSVKLETTVTKNGAVVYNAQNGNSVRLGDVATGVGTYNVIQTLYLWDDANDALARSRKHTYRVSIKEPPAAVTLTDIVITTPPTKTSYKEGDTLMFDGMRVFAYFSDGTSRELQLGSEYTLDPPTGTVVQEGQTYFTIKYTAGNVTKTAKQAITVTPADYAIAFITDPVIYIDVPVGYTSSITRTLIVKNVGDQKITSGSDITLSGEHADVFTLSREQLWAFFVDGERDFNISHIAGLSEGEYTADVTVTNTSAGVSASCKLVLRVYAPATLSGTITSFGRETENVYVRVYEEGADVPSYEVVLNGENEVTYEITDIIPAYYRVEVSKAGHVTSSGVTYIDGNITRDIWLERYTVIDSVELEMNGYALAQAASDVTVTEDTDGVEVYASIMMDMFGNEITSERFAAQSVYFLAVHLQADEGYDITGLDGADCPLGDATVVQTTYNAEYNMLSVVYQLPELEAVEINSIELEAYGYTPGAQFGDLTVSSLTDGVGVVYYAVCDQGLNSMVSGQFAIGNQYYIAVHFAVADGCEVLLDDANDITLNGVPVWYSTQDQTTGEYIVAFQMPELKTRHDVTFVVDGTTVSTQSVADGETATEPEEPYKDNYVFLGWYTDNGEKYDFTTPVTEPLTLTAKMAEGYTVILYLGDIESPVAGFTVEAGKPMDEPAEPGQEGKVFLGWYTADGDLYDFSLPVVQDLHLIATFADEETTVYVGGVALKDGEYLDESGYVSTTALADNYAGFKDGVLTLHNFDYEGVGYYNAMDDYYAIVYSEESLEICLEGSNTFYDGDASEYTCGVVGHKDLTFSGNGSLEITTSGVSVYNYNGLLTVKSGTFDFTTEENGFVSNENGVWIRGGNITIDCLYSGIYACYDIDIDGGNITIVSHEGDGIYSDYGTVTITGGNITIDAYDDGIYGYDDDAIEDITITGGTIDITAGYYGLNADSTGLTISGGDITVRAEYYGLYCYDGDMLLAGGDVDVCSTDESYCALYCDAGTIIIVADLTVTAADEYDGTLGAYVEEDNSTYNRVVIEDASNVLKGDVNLDGSINMRDAMLLYSCVSSGLSLSDEQQAAGDMDENGTLNMRDVMRLYALISNG